MTGVVVDSAEEGAEETVPSGIEIALKESSNFSQRGLALFAYPSPLGAEVMGSNALGDYVGGEDREGTWFRNRDKGQGQREAG